MADIRMILGYAKQFVTRCKVCVVKMAEVNLKLELSSDDIRARATRLQDNKDYNFFHSGAQKIEYPKETGFKQEPNDSQYTEMNGVSWSDDFNEDTDALGW